MSRKIKVLAPVILALGVLAGLFGLGPAGLGTGVAQANPGWCNSWHGNNCNVGWDGWRGGDRCGNRCGNDCWDRCNDWQRPPSPPGDWRWDGWNWVPPFPPPWSDPWTNWVWDGWQWRC